MLEFSKAAEGCRSVWHRWCMEQRVSLITLAVADVDASKRFYLDGWDGLRTSMLPVKSS